MIRQQCRILEVFTRQFGSSLVSSASASATAIEVELPYDFSEGGGEALIDDTGQTVVYTKANMDTGVLTLSSATYINPSAEEGGSVFTIPFSEEKIAVVDLGDEQDPFEVLVPFSMQVQLLDGIRSEETGFESAAIELDGDQWVIKEIYGQFADISTAYEGDRIVFDRDGLAGYTNDPVRGGIIQSPLSWIVADETWLFGSDNSEPPTEYIRKFNIDTGEETVTGGWPKSTASTFDPIFMASDGTSLFTGDFSANNKIRKIDIDTGTQIVTGGWPKTIPAFSLFTLDSNGTWLVADYDGAIHKLSVDDATEDTTGDWPLTPPPGFVYGPHGANDDWVIVLESDLSGTGIIHKFSIIDGVEDTSGEWPVETTDYLPYIRVNDSHFFIDDGNVVDGNSGIKKYRIEDGVEILENGWPLNNPDDESGFIEVAVNNNWLVANTSFTTVSKFNLLEDFESLRISSTSGSLTAQEIDSSIITTSVITTDKLVGPAQDLSVFSSRATRSAAHTIANNTETKISFDSFASSGKSTPYFYFDNTFREFVITETGLYRIEAGIAWPSNATGFRILRLQVNGGNVTGSMTAASGAFLFLQNASYTVVLGAGGTVAVAGHHNAGVALDISNGGTFLTLTRLGTIDT